MLDEALSVLDRASEKVTGPNAHIALYQLGAMLVQMNEFDRAQPHFQRILNMPKPSVVSGLQTPPTNGVASSPPSTEALPGINTHKFNLPQGLIREIQGPAFGSGSGSQWIPKSFEEAQVGALVQLATLAQQQRKLGEWLEQLEAKAEANPKNIRTLETLAQLYTLTQNTDKVMEITQRLIAVSPKDPVYQSLWLNQAIEQNMDYETLKKYLDEMTGLTAEARLWYLALHANRSYRQGLKVDAEELVAVLETSLRLEPTHPTLCHFYIHTMELSANPEKALSAANILRTQALKQGHLLHMPSHIDMWLGHYGDAIDINKVAIAADEAYVAQTGHDNEFYKAY